MASDHHHQLTASLTQEGEWYVAQCLEVNVASQGHDPEEALANLREALELYFEDEPEDAIPRAAIIRSIDLAHDAG
jgi:predicted RNase H-like HicB family nuclease